MGLDALVNQKSLHYIAKYLILVKMSPLLPECYTIWSHDTKMQAKRKNAVSKNIIVLLVLKLSAFCVLRCKSRRLKLFLFTNGKDDFEKGKFTL